MDYIKLEHYLFKLNINGFDLFQKVLNNTGYLLGLAYSKNCLNSHLLKLLHYLLEDKNMKCYYFKLFYQFCYLKGCLPGFTNMFSLFNSNYLLN